MQLYIICYDIKPVLHDYSSLYNEIKILAGDGNYQHPLDNMWMIATEKDAGEIYLKLKPKLVIPGDRIFITEMNKGNRQGWMSKIVWNWMKKY